MQITDPFTWHNSEQKQAKHGPLAGRRLAVKDLFHIAGVATGAGNPDWLQSHPIPDTTSKVVTDLLSAGCHLIGKTHTDELAYSLNGQNVHYGTLRNPNAPDSLPGGSSSGSAIAVAMGLADIGLGTDTGGSIRVPASYNGLWGLRPSHGSIPMQDMVPLAPQFDTVGWLTRSIGELTDVARILLSSKKAPIPIKQIITTPDLLRSVSHSAEISDFLQKLPCPSIESNIDTNFVNQASQAFRVLQGHNIWQTHGEWITETQPTFAADIQQRLDWCATITAEEVRAARQVQAKVSALLTSTIGEDSVLLLPTTPGAAPRLDTPTLELAQYRETLMGLTSLAGLAGSPQVHMPLPSPGRAPAGVSLIAARGCDLELLEFSQNSTKDIL